MYLKLFILLCMKKPQALQQPTMHEQILTLVKTYTIQHILCCKKKYLPPDFRKLMLKNPPMCLKNGPKFLYTDVKDSPSHLL